MSATEAVSPEPAKEIPLGLLAPRDEEAPIEIKGLPDVPEAVIAFIVEHFRFRRDLHDAGKRLLLQQISLCRRLAPEGNKKIAKEIHKAWIKQSGEYPAECLTIEGTSIPVLRQCQVELDIARRKVEKELRKAAESLPIWEAWAKDVVGFGPLGLAIVVGEAGRDISCYYHWRCLWKRMGLAVIRGERQRRIAGTTEEKKALAIEHGYDGERRSSIWTIGSSATKKRDTWLRGIYDYEKERSKTNPLHADWTDGHHHAHAERLMSKELVKQLWIRWTGWTGGEVTTH